MLYALNSKMSIKSKFSVQTHNLNSNSFFFDNYLFLWLKKYINSSQIWWLLDHPRNSHVAAIKSAQNKLVYTEIASSCKSIQECSIDVTLAKIGGCQQLIILLAKVNFS